jgi:hypothetical protein
MLYNSKQQVVTLSLGNAMLCTQGLEDTANGHPNSKAAKARIGILSPLRETKEQSNPYGRGTGGMFSLETRTRVTLYPN